MFDAHVHLDFPSLAEGSLDRARAAGVTGFIVPGVEPEQWTRAATLGLPMCIGVHPQHPVTIDTQTLVDAARRHHAVGIGECGLDRRGPTGHEHQLGNLYAHIEAAKQLDLPLVLHVVQRHGATLDVLDATTTGMVHAFVGSREVAERWLDRGYLLSVGPMVMRSKKLRDAIPHIPLDRLLVETDAPDGCGEPAELVDVLRHIAMLRGEPVEKLASATEANARRLFRLSA